MRIAKKIFPPVAAALLICVLAGLALAAYGGHKEKDTPLFLSVYPDAAGTALDGCATCHRTGTAIVLGDPQGNPVPAHACDFCHAAMITNNKPAAYSLNPYGHDYLRYGRNARGLRSLGATDSDGDGVSNADEITARTLPGDPHSAPALPEAPSAVLTLDTLLTSLPVQNVPVFMNVTKNLDGDRYDDYRGFLLVDILRAAGMSEAAQSVDVISVDGYAKTFTIAQLREIYEQSAPVFGLGEKDLGDCAIAKYHAKNLTEGQPLPLASVMLTFEMNGELYDKATMAPDTGKLSGLGPWRSMTPQMSRPSPPDLSSRAPESCNDTVDPAYHYHGFAYEKNSDYCVKAVVALQVNPLPPGTRAPHWQPDAMKHIQDNSIIVYGALNNTN